MAGMNWEQYVVNLAGQPVESDCTNCSGAGFHSPAGVEVEFYKNWLYVRDPKGWSAGSGSFSEPTVLEVQKGELRYKDVFIQAVRGPFDGIYAAVWVGSAAAATDGVIGCGVDGFTEKGVWKGVRPESIAFLESWVGRVRPADGFWEKHALLLPEKVRAEFLANMALTQSYYLPSQVATVNVRPKT